MSATISMLMGYLLGSLSPSALISALKKKNLKQIGTKNLGATNTMLAFGKWYGILVMVIDIMKAFISVKLAKLLFPDLAISGLLAGCCAVAGHIFSVFLKFKGGRGLATFVGLVLALDLRIFMLLLIIGIALIFITNYAIALPVSAAVLFPFLAGYRFQSPAVFVLLLAVSGLIIFKHLENIRRIKDGTEIKARTFLKERLHSEY